MIALQEGKPGSGMTLASVVLVLWPIAGFQQVRISKLDAVGIRSFFQNGQTWESLTPVIRGGR